MMKELEKEDSDKGLGDSELVFCTWENGRRMKEQGFK